MRRGGDNEARRAGARRWTALLRLLRELWYEFVNRREVLGLGLLLLLGGFLAWRTETFFGWTNISNILRAFSWIAIAAFGEGMIIIIGGIDLSVGAVMALSGLTSALSLDLGLPVFFAILVGLLTGALVGWINGLLVGHLNLPPFMVTLGTMSIARGLIFGLTGGWPVRTLPPEFRAFGQNSLNLGIFALPVPVLIMLGLALLMELLLTQTVLGRYIYTLGHNEEALRVVDVSVRQIKVLVYTLGGLLTAVGGLLMTARLGVAVPTAATGYELNIIAAAVIGGASLFGGEGNVRGILLGAIIMQVMQNGLVLLGFPAYWQTLAIGIMILLFILLDHWRRQHRSRGGGRVGG
ncbi:MAG: ABC transporter permease [Anaerolineae bacterium]